MEEGIKRLRALAVQRYIAGESPESICTSLGKSRFWLYKWVKRFSVDNPLWFEDHSRRPFLTSNRTPSEIEEIVKMVRLNLYNQNLFCGAQAILWEIEDLGVNPLPSIRTINRILARNELTHRRTGRYEPKGTLYPALPEQFPNQTHQADFVGPCYLKGPIRFYSLNIVDTATVRCGLQPSLSMAAQNVLDGFWAAWKRIGIPDRVQIDNTMSFFGSLRHPRAMGPLIRLCLHNGVEPWFIPMAEPWRNGMVENFNDRYQQRFLGKVVMASIEELKTGSLAFEQRHNSRYRYSKLKGGTPLKALAASNVKLRFPTKEEAPQHPLGKPEVGKYHVVRLIRSDLKLDIFGERFPAPPETMLAYVVATIDVKEQKLKLFLDKAQVEEFDYKLR
ncbi:helix-turn-helix domain-containing protein [Desulfuromonas sp. CSMB_57]|uniref:helix-turn-helix domain-containing protein n=1 Tax=Desulfuromonas sp. CSMB_57 TaxID=2807629 RepID=UPI001CD69AA6|nr:helix-turn-helix domain-containing protein [Desulfuromonas sp. CSMB_57]